VKSTRRSRAPPRVSSAKNVPFITGSYAQTFDRFNRFNHANPFQTIDRKDVGLTLKVKPQIAEGGSIKLQLLSGSIFRYYRCRPLSDSRHYHQQTLRTVHGTGGRFPNRGYRRIVQDEVNSSKSGIPVLSSIPILGNLFRSETRNRTKTNLMIFLRPHVLREDKAAAQFTEDRYDFIRNQQIKAKPGEHLILPNFDGPQLPPIGDQAQPRYTRPLRRRRALMLQRRNRLRVTG